MRLSDRLPGRLAAAFATLAFLALAPAPAVAVTQSPQWTVTAISGPTNFERGASGIYTVTVMNTGGAPSNGEPVTVTDTLPSEFTLGGAEASGQDHLSGGSLSCVALTCTYAGPVVPDDSLELTIPVAIGSGASSTETNNVTASGGGAPVASLSTPTTVSSTPAGFGLSPGSEITALSSMQAGAHADLTTTLAFNTDGVGVLAADPKTTVDDLPPGFAGDLADTPTCPVADFSKESGFFAPQTCPLSTQIGTTALTLNLGFKVDHTTIPIYNLTPNPGEVAKLGFFAVQFGVQGEVSVRPGDYGVRTVFRNIDETPAEVDSASLSIWGVPSDHSHDAMRGLLCTKAGRCQYCNTTACVPGGELSGQSLTSSAIPYLTNPTECSTEPLHATLSATSWQQPDEAVTSRSNVGLLTGCNLLEFSPWIEEASPDVSSADSPAGLAFDLKVPQEGLTTPEGLSTADVKNTMVGLPAGLVINPGRAAGLQACQFSEDGVGRDGPASCPPASQVGTDEVKTPLLKQSLDGSVYVLQSNPPDVKVLVTASAPVYGIYVKLIGDVRLDPETGQVTTRFSEAPELPFSDFKLFFTGGAQGALATPTVCGVYAIDADFTPWTAPAGQDALATRGFTINSGPDGSGCPSALPFAPALVAGATSDQAGGFTDFSLLLQRADGQQRISTLQVETPEGLLGMISKVPLCDEPQAAHGTCSSSSQIGHVVVEAGPGRNPLVVPQPGAPQAPIYLTGAYRGAPYGLSTAVPVVAGPFDLGTVVVRSKIEVDPHTSRLTITTDPLPSILDGVPTDLRTIDAVIDREGFMFNPTDCNPQSISGTTTSTEGAAAAISSPFRIGSCQSLPFKPRLTALTRAKTSKAAGASLHVKVVSGPGQANIAKVEVNLPKQLPSRLTTLQQACPDATFNADPASCPAGSLVGTAMAVTAVLRNPLSGPAYLVSHAGASFPNLVIVLQGEGITLEEIGTTDIKRGITTSTFNSVPDAPISTFDLVLPEGPHSALAAYGDLCRSKLNMPTAITGQNGAVIKQSTKIAVAGCRRHGRARRAKAHGNARRATRWRAQTPERGLPSGHLSTAPGGTPSSPLL